MSTRFSGIGRPFGRGSAVVVTIASEVKLASSEGLRHLISYPIECYLYIDYQESSYVGCLMFNDLAFARHITTLLLCYWNRTIVEIGSLDITHLL